MSEARELLKRAASALHDTFDGVKYMEPLIEEIDAYLAKPEPEPVAFMSKNLDAVKLPSNILTGSKRFIIPLYAEPPARKPLSDKEVLDIANDHFFQYGENELSDVIRAIRETEKAHGIE